MVVFTCNACGEPLKKNQVEKHYQTKCRKCEVLSCVDCGKDFWGDDYQKHTKCISEEEKYSGKNYIPKSNANKGEVKQEQWIQQVQAAIEKSRSNPRLRNTLECIQDYPNIPRKKTKFENFMKNSLNVRDSQVVNQVWDVLMVNIDKVKNTEAKKSASDSDGTEEQQQPEDLPAKLNKRERKKERRKNMNKKEKKDKSVPETDSSVNGDGEIHQKKKNKRKREETESDSPTQEEKDSDGLEEQQQPEEAPAKLSKREGNDGRKKKMNKKDRSFSETESNHLIGDSEIHQKKKKKKRKHEEIESDSQSQEEKEAENTIDQGDGEKENEEERQGKPPQKRTKIMFDWEEVITQVLKSKGEEMSVKKLKKKVLAEYLFKGGSDKSEEKLWAKFNKKLMKNPKFKVFKDRVKLSKH